MCSNKETATGPSPGYISSQMSSDNFNWEVDALRTARERWITEEDRILHILSKQEPLQMACPSRTYSDKLRRNLIDRLCHIHLCNDPRQSGASVPCSVRRASLALAEEIRSQMSCTILCKLMILTFTDSYIITGRSHTPVSGLDEMGGTNTTRSACMHCTVPIT